MSDRRKTTPPAVPIPPEPQPRCPGTSPAGERCALPPGHEEPRYHQAESGAWRWGEPYPPLPPGPASEGAVLRETFKIQLLPEDAAAIKQTADAAAFRAREGHDLYFDMVMAIEAAAGDLEVTAAWLDHFADDRGDGPERHEIHLAAAVLDAVPVIAQTAEALRAQVQLARKGAPAAPAE